MLTIRLSRVGKKNKPMYRLVISEKVRDPYGRALEILGSYNPHTKELQAKNERIKYWISKGSQTSPTVNNLLIAKGVIEGKKIKTSKAKKKKKGAEKDEQPVKPVENVEKTEKSAEKKDDKQRTTDNGKTDDKKEDAPQPVEEKKADEKPTEDKKEEAPKAEEKPKEEEGEKKKNKN